MNATNRYAHFRPRSSGVPLGDSFRARGRTCGPRAEKPLFRRFPQSSPARPYEGRTLVVILCMHRSGSSLTANMLQQLGMSLGPFPLMGANKHGHFESMPFYQLDKELLGDLFGFDEDIPNAPDVFQRFCRGEGRWRWDYAVPESMLRRGRDLVRELIASGPISGFKDPRVPLLWPFWSRVFSAFPGLRVFPLFVVRSPHEVAMSIFSRSFDVRVYNLYRDSLDITAVHFKRMIEMRANWKGETALVRFEPRVFRDDVRRAAATIGLPWRGELFDDVYDASCRHHEPGAIEHDAQRLFDAFVGEPTAGRLLDPENLARLECDAALRESVARRHLLTLRGENAESMNQLQNTHRQFQESQRQAEDLAVQVSRSRADLEQASQDLRQSQGELRQCRSQLDELGERLLLSTQEGSQLRRDIELVREQLGESLEQCRRRAIELEESQRAVADLEQARAGLEQALARWRDECRGAQESLAQTERSLARSHAENEMWRGDRRRMQQQVTRLENELSLITGSRTWRLRGRIIRALRPARAHEEAAAGADRRPPCTIIIPVYNAFRETLACIRSVLRHTPDPYRLLVLDDASPEGSLAEFLPGDVLSDPRVQVIRHAENQGFVKSCNLGIHWTHPRDVVLLNSDTEVTGGWLEKLREAAYSSPHVGTVTPLTNNGTICSVPRFLENNELPEGCSLDDFAALVERASAREYPEVPTCVGFCVYIKREVLDRVGAFDEDSFGKGYGEENDFSCRAQAAGYADIVDDATFVYHKGRMSFQGTGDDLTAEHLRILEKRHPAFIPRVHQFIAANPMRSIHRRIQEGMLRRWMEGSEYTVLHVLHNPPLTPGAQGLRLPGGTEFHVADLIRTIPRAAHWSLFAAGGAYCLTAHVRGGQEQRFSFSAAERDIDSLIDPGLFDVVHLHHINGHAFEPLTEALARHGNYFVSLHDFRMCCPRIQLLAPGDRHCDRRECAAACGVRPSEIEGLRSTASRLFHGARAVIHFSESTRKLFGEMLGAGFPWKLVEHGIPRANDRRLQTGPPPEWPKPSKDRPLKVAFLGGAAPHKGLRLMQQVLRRRTLPSGIPVEWHVIGMINGELPDGPHIFKHGRYEREELPAIFEKVSPHLVAIPSIWPETYCFTIDEALSNGVPVLCTPLGAPPERVRRSRCGWVLDRLECGHVLARLQSIVDSWESYCGVRRNVAVLPLRDTDAVAETYDRAYRSTRESWKSPAVDGRIAAIARLVAHQTCTVRRGRLLVGRAINGCDSLLGKLGARSVLRRVLQRFLPHRVQSAIRDLRSTQLPPAENTREEASPRARAA